MDNYGQKLRLILIPFLIASAGSVIVYSLLRWLLFIKSSAVTVDEDILNFWAPWAFTWIPITIWLRPIFKLLDLTTKSNRGDPLFGLMVCASIGMVAPIVVAQFYLTSETGKLTSLEKISQIDSVPKTKYYSVKHYYADKKLARFKTRFKVSGRFSSNFDMYIYVAVPVYDLNHTTKTYSYIIGRKEDRINSENALIVLNGKVVQREMLHSINPRSIKAMTVLKANAAISIYGSQAKNGAILVETKPYNGPDTLEVIHDDNMNYTAFAWLGWDYYKSVSNNLTTADKNVRYKQFAKECEDNFKSKSLDNFVYLDRVAYSADLKQYLAAVNSPNYQALPKTSTNILAPVYDLFNKRTSQTLPWIFGAFALGAIYFGLLLLIKPLRDDVLREIGRQDKSQQIIDEIIGENSNARNA